MKKIIIILGIACISASTIAQRAVRIGNMEITVRIQDQDTTMQVNVLDTPCPPCPSDENEKPRPKPKEKWFRHTQSTGFGGFGFIIPDKSNSYYTMLGGNSINIEGGWINRFHLSRHLALIGILQGSYYNYKLHDAVYEPNFMAEITDGKDFSGEKIHKQVYRSYNAALAVGARFYLMPPSRRGSNSGVYLDLGVQSDLAFSRRCKVITQSETSRYFNDYAFNPFTASYFARLGRKSFAVFARYRFTDAFNSEVLPIDLPPLTIGLHFF